MFRGRAAKAGFPSFTSHRKDLRAILTGRMGTAEPYRVSGDG